MYCCVTVTLLRHGVHTAVPTTGAQAPWVKRQKYEVHRPPTSSSDEMNVWNSASKVLIASFLSMGTPPSVIATGQVWRSRLNDWLTAWSWSTYSHVQWCAWHTECCRCVGRSCQSVTVVMAWWWWWLFAECWVVSFDVNSVSVGSSLLCVPFRLLDQLTDIHKTWQKCASLEDTSMPMCFCDCNQKQQWRTRELTRPERF